MPIISGGRLATIKDCVFPITIRQTERILTKAAKLLILDVRASDAVLNSKIVTRVKHLQALRPLSLKVSKGNTMAPRPVLSKYERASTISARMQQICNGSKPRLEQQPDETGRSREESSKKGSFLSSYEGPTRQYNQKYTRLSEMVISDAAAPPVQVMKSAIM
jgi:hypothetical protein